MNIDTEIARYEILNEIEDIEHEESKIFKRARKHGNMLTFKEWKILEVLIDRKEQLNKQLEDLNLT